MLIRVAKEEDIEGIQKLLLQVNQIHADGRPDLFKNSGIKYTREALVDKLKLTDETIFVAVEDEVLGYAFVQIENVEENTSLCGRKVLYIDDLCIDESKRGMHIGQKLFERVKEYAKEIGAYHVTLRVWELNGEARGFYEKMGFVPLYTEMEMKI